MKTDQYERCISKKFNIRSRTWGVAMWTFSFNVLVRLALLVTGRWHTFTLWCFALVSSSSASEPSVHGNQGTIHNTGVFVLGEFVAAVRLGVDAGGTRQVHV
jgi:hypothetical protein